jgi:DNA-directed RNA polymerase specialized sigma24 family protein
MKRFCYDGVLEDWKVELALQRARRMRLRDDELDDVIQELVLTMLDIEFDDDHADGATERTMLTSVIDRQLCKMRRSAARRQDLEQQVAIPADATYDDSHVQLRLDVETVLGAVDDEHRRVGNLLSQGYSKAAIAKQLGCGWHTVDRIVSDIRKKFEAHGFGEE